MPFSLENFSNFKNESSINYINRKFTHSKNAAIAEIPVQTNRAQSGSIFNLISRTNSIKANEESKSSLLEKKVVMNSNYNIGSEKSLKVSDDKLTSGLLRSLQDKDVRSERFSFLKQLGGKLNYYFYILEKYSKIEDISIFNKLDTIEYYKIVIGKRILKEKLVKDDCKRSSALFNKRKNERRMVNKEKCEIVSKIKQLKEEYNVIKI